MRCELGADQIESYRRDGYLVIDDFLDEDELAIWRHAFDEAVRERLDAARRVASSEQAIGEVPPPDEDIRPEVWPPSLRFVQFMNVWRSHSTMRSLLHDPRIGRMATELAGVDGVRVWYDQTFIKAPWAGATPLHQDNPYWSFTSTDAISLWLALDDVEVSSGALCYLPGTHLDRSWRQAEDVSFDAIFRVHEEWADIEPVFCPVRAGALLWHNGLTVHGSGPNMAPRPRRVMNCAFMPVGSTFNGIQNVLPDSVFSTLTEGDPLDDDERNPLVYSAAATTTV